MSRAAIYDRVVAVTGLPKSNVIANYSGEGRPSNIDPNYPAFIVIKWQESTVSSQTYTGMSNGIAKAPRVVEIWVHYPMERSDDFNRVDAILDDIEPALTSMEHVNGADGYSVVCVGYSGRSRDNKDEGYGTICRHSSFTVLQRKT